VASHRKYPLYSHYIFSLQSHISVLYFFYKGTPLRASSYLSFVPPSPVLDPTVLERDDPIQLPMDLLIHDEKDEDVIFEVNAARRNPNITCNPLYEHSLRDEEAEKFSLKSFQSGFKTDFDNVNFIRVGQLCH